MAFQARKVITLVLLRTPNSCPGGDIPWKVLASVLLRTPTFVQEVMYLEKLLHRSFSGPQHLAQWWCTLKSYYIGPSQDPNICPSGDVPWKVITSVLLMTPTFVQEVLYLEKLLHRSFSGPQHLSRRCCTLKAITSVLLRTPTFVLVVMYLEKLLHRSFSGPQNLSRRWCTLKSYYIGPSQDPNICPGGDVSWKVLTSVLLMTPTFVQEVMYLEKLLHRSFSGPQHLSWWWCILKSSYIGPSQDPNICPGDDVPWKAITSVLLRTPTFVLVVMYLEKFLHRSFSWPQHLSRRWCTLKSYYIGPSQDPNICPGGDVPWKVLTSVLLRTPTFVQEVMYLEKLLHWSFSGPQHLSRRWCTLKSFLHR